MVSAHQHLYHVTPLHYLPHIIRDGSLYAKSILATRGISPRETAKRRDQMLGLADYVHLSLRPDTPLLADKIAQGFCHVLLVFNRAAVLGLPQVAFLPYNTKAWHTRAAFAPVMEADAQTEMLRLHYETGRYPSLEVLVKYGLELTALERITLAAAEEYAGIHKMLSALGLKPPSPLVIDPTAFPGIAAASITREAVLAYFEDCIRDGRLLPPPEIPFD